MLSNFLLYARPKALTFAKCDILHEVMIPTIGLLKQDPRFPGDHTTIEIDAPVNFPKIVCDVEQIQQVFWNLCLNAFQAMPRGGVLTITTRIEKLDQWELATIEPIYAGVISLHDTGDGIDQDTLRHIFHPFYTTKKKGSGLGLAIAHSIVKQHHGLIKVKSTPQTGATFDVVLPLTQ
jgi:two-component system sensor histidine kinase PilS (NtrC family)